VYHSPFFRRAASNQLAPFFSKAFSIVSCPTSRSNSAMRSACSSRVLLAACLLSNSPGALSRNSCFHLYTSESVMSRSRHTCAVGFSPRSTSITVSNLNCALNCRCLRAMFVLHRFPLYPFSFLCPTIRPQYKLPALTTPPATTRDDTSRHFVPASAPSPAKSRSRYAALCQDYTRHQYFHFIPCCYPVNGWRKLRQYRYHPPRQINHLQPFRQVRSRLVILPHLLFNHVQSPAYRSSWSRTAVNGPPATISRGSNGIC